MVTFKESETNYNVEVLTYVQSYLLIHVAKIELRKIIK